MQKTANLGDNKPPSQIEFATSSATELGEWLKDNPVVQDEEVARLGKLQLDRMYLCIKDVEDERRGRKRPLRDEIQAIDDEYRPIVTLCEKLYDELKGRLGAWIRQEQERKQKEAAEARRQAEESEQRARIAEAREQAAKEEAQAGVEVDLVAATREADQAFEEFKRDERAVARADAATNVKVAGGWGRAISAKSLTTRELVVIDPAAALARLGWSERLIEALKSDARDYRRRHGEWPNGVIERTM